MSQVYRGTIAQLAGNVKLGEHVLGQVELSNLTRLGNGVFCRQVGTVPKPEGQRGRAASIWEFDTSISMAFQSDTVALTDATPASPNAEAPADETPEA